MIYLVERLQRMLQTSGFLDEIQSLIVGMAMTQKVRRIELAKCIFQPDEHGEFICWKKFGTILNRKDI